MSHLVFLASAATLRILGAIQRGPVSKWICFHFLKLNLSYYAFDEGFGFKNRNFGGFSPGKEVPKTIFGPQWPRRRHNLD
jgi:hypothetical protein